MRKRIFVFSLIFVILSAAASACAPAAPASAPIETGTSQPLGINQTVTYPPTYTITPTRTMYPTQIPFYTSTPVPTKTQPPTRPTSTPSIYPTPDTEFWHIPESISPTGKWVVWQLDCSAYSYISYDMCLQFINAEGTKSWFFTENVLNFNDVFFSTIVKVAHWSVDNKFVYLVLYPHDLEAQFFPIYGIIKFSLVNGTYSYVITPDYDIKAGDSPLQWPLYYEYGFSNDSQQLVYAIKNEHSLDFTLLDLYSGETEYFSVIVDEDSFFGAISWSPNDRIFVFSVAENLIGPETSDDFSIFLVTLEDLSVKRIYPHGNVFLYLVEWVSNKEIKYYYMDTNLNSGEIILNIQTGEVTEVEE